MERFSRQEFLGLPEPERKLRCAELARLLTPRIKGSPRFHHAVTSVIEELRALGHDLWSYDASDDMEAWGPDYVKHTGPGVTVRFYIDDETEVGWSKH